MAATEDTTAYGITHRTTYLETLMHVLKANIGTGLFAMGDAVKNSGLLLGPWLIAFLGFICVYCEHLLLNASNELKENLSLDQFPDYATTVEMCFSAGPESVQKCSKLMKRIVNVFLCVTQLGFGCVYIVFVASTLQEILDEYGHYYNIRILMAIVTIPILLTCMIRNLKYLAPVSALANLLLVVSAILCFYYTSQDIPDFSERNYVASVQKLPLFFGTALFAFEGIGVVIPLKSDMKNPPSFDAPLGALNIGKFCITLVYTVMGFMSYLKYGEKIMGSITLNLKGNVALAVKCVTGSAIMFTYAIQYYVAFQILWDGFCERAAPFSHPLLCEMLFRTAIVALTFILAEAIPYLNLFISLVGACSSTALALLFPPVLEYTMAHSKSRLTVWIIAKDLFIFAVGVIGTITGTYQSVIAIVEQMHNLTEAEVTTHRWTVF